VRADSSAVLAGVDRVGGDQPGGSDDRVRDPHGPFDVRGEARDCFASALPVDHVGRNPDVLAGVALRLEVGRIVVGQLHEQPSRLSDTVASDVPEDAVFLEALPRLPPVGLGVASAAVEQSV